MNDVDELAARRRRWGRIRAAALAAMVLTFLFTVALLVAGSGGEDEVTVELPDASFEVRLLRLNDEPVAVVRNGGQFQVLRLTAPDGADVGYCDSAEVFVEPDGGSVFDLDGIPVAGAAGTGLERFDFVPGPGEITIDLSAVEAGVPDGAVPAVSSSDRGVQECLENQPVRFPPLE